MTLLFVPLFGLFLFALWLWSSRYRQPSADFSTLKYLKPASWRGKLPTWLSWGGLALLLLAFLDLHWMLPREGRPNPQGGAFEGIGIYLILDQSGSMSDPVSTGGKPKFELLKQYTRAFIQGRQNDLLGMIAFARGAHVIVPLTLDHRALIEALNELQVDNDPEQEGTGIGYAIFKTAQIIDATKQYAEKLPAEQRPAYDIKSTAMILVTDGLQDPSDKDKGKRFRTMDIPEAAAYAKQAGIHLYIVNVDPQFGTAQYAPNLHQMERAAESTGGKFFLASSSSSSLGEIYRSIDQLEKSHFQSPLESLPKEKLPRYFKRVSFYPELIVAGLLALLAALLLRGTTSKVFP